MKDTGRKTKEHRENDAGKLFAKLFDMHMMCWGTGRERTESEYASLLTQSGWTFVQAKKPEDRAMGVVIGVKK